MVAKRTPVVELQPSWGLSGTNATSIDTNVAGACYGSDTFVSGQWYEATSTSNTVDLSGSECTELSFMIDTNEATASTTYRLRLVKSDGTLFTSYLQYPTLTIVPDIIASTSARYSKDSIMTTGSGCDTSSWNCIAPDTANNTGYDPAIAIGTDGLPVIAYWFSSGGDLKVFKCGNVDCTAGNTITTVVNSSDGGRQPSIAIAPDGNPVITYFDNGLQEMHIVKCGNSTCSEKNTNTSLGSAPINNDPWQSGQTVCRLWCQI